MVKYIIDIDDTICEMPDINDYSYENLINRKPIKETIKVVNNLFKQGHYIVFFTSRPSWDYEVTKEWLIKNEIRFNQLIMGKPLGDVYIDDKNMLLEDFQNGN